MGMVVAPAAIELEEIIRQAVPTREGHPEVRVGNLIGTLFYFVLFNLGLIALITPVDVDPLVRWLDWPALVVVTLVASAFLAHGRIGRREVARCWQRMACIWSLTLCRCDREFLLIVAPARHSGVGIELVGSDRNR
jgi:Ca2+/Na+ antiporter